jgi:hypothetical protein
VRGGLALFPASESAKDGTARATLP